MKTHYETLGVSRDASLDEIKQSYRKLSLKWHPDRNSSSEAQSRFQEIGAAYEILSDEKRRHEYNCELDGVHIGGNGIDISDLFNMMFAGGGGMPPGEFRFGNGRGPEIHVFHGDMPGMFQSPFGHPLFKQMQKPEPIINHFTLSLEQAYTGCTLCFTINKWIIQDNIKTQQEETIYVNIPPGIDTAEVIVMQECGNVGPNNIKGDAHFIAKIEPSSTYERHGMDLLHKRTITLKEALTGFMFEITHINGKLLCLDNLKNRTIISPNYRKTIPNMGMVRNGNTGNLIIEFNVSFPDKLTEEQITQLQNIL
jgi:DnaJ-class molecular chaperone